MENRLTLCRVVPPYFLVTELNAWIAGKQIKKSEVCDPSLVHRAYFLYSAVARVIEQPANL